MSPAGRVLELRPFQPRFSQEQLDDLTASIRAARLPAKTYASRQTKYGITHDWMQKALERWTGGFDWKEYEEDINNLDNYMVEVESGDVKHELHVVLHESKSPDAIPLLLLHGWPSSAFDFTHVIKILRESTTPAFHLIAPMQPGYGWSSPPPLDRRFTMEDCAELLNELMIGLGYGGGYAVQGGDIGAALARLIAVKYDACKCMHINFMPAVPLPEDAPERRELKPHEVRALEKAKAFSETGRGYAIMHETRPGTIGIVVGSSPVALLAWIGEKFLTWTDEAPPLDTILAICTMWWIRDSYPSSIWAYPGELQYTMDKFHQDAKYRLDKPFGISSFKEEINMAPEVMAKRNGNLQFFRYHDKGGHFAALEQPETFAKYLQDCFGQIWSLQQK